jgi:hypothetical protein
MTAESVKNTNWVGMTILESNRFSARLRNRICRIPVTTSTWNRRSARGLHARTDAAHEQDWVRDPFCKHLCPLFGQERGDGLGC